MGPGTLRQNSGTVVSSKGSWRVHPRGTVFTRRTKQCRDSTGARHSSYWAHAERGLKCRATRETWSKWRFPVRMSPGCLACERQHSRTSRGSKTGTASLLVDAASGCAGPRLTTATLDILLSKSVGHGVLLSSIEVCIRLMMHWLPVHAARAR